MIFFLKPVVAAIISFFVIIIPSLCLYLFV